MIKEIHAIREQSKLSQIQLTKLGCDGAAIKRLVASGILKAEKSDNFRADFVGIAASGKENLQFVPKYLSSFDNCVITAEMNLVVRVLRKYSRHVSPYHPDATFLRPISSENSLSGFALADALLTDYFIHGLYRPKTVKRKMNGKGSIDWSKTISQTTPYFSRRAPIYTNLITRISSVDSAHWVARIHFEAINLAATRFGGLLGFQPILLSHESITPVSPLPPRSFIRAVLQRELSESFSERNIRLIRLLQGWYSDAGASDNESLSLFGVGSFHTVWEAICGALFSNKMSEYSKFIPKPEWETVFGERQEGSTLIPDIVTYSDEKAENKVFLLLDAKYYRAVMPPNLAHQPGISDITKQLFYEQALTPRLNLEGFNRVVNGFLFPKYGGDLFEFAGTVKLPSVKGGPIAIFYLNASEVMKRYIGSNQLSTDELQKFISSVS